MTTVNIHFDFSDDSDASEDFEVCGCLQGEIVDYAEGAAQAKSEGCDEPVECEKWEVFETSLDYEDQRDWDDFDNLNDWAEYCDLVEEHGEAFVLRYDDLGGCDNLDDYQGCWASDEEFVRSVYEECYDIPKHLEFYIDWEKVTRDVMYDYSSYEVYDGYHIFRN